MSQPYVPGKKAKPPKNGIVAGLIYFIFYRVVFAVVTGWLTVLAINYIWHLDFMEWYPSMETLAQNTGPAYAFVPILGQIIALLALWLVFLGRDKKFFKEIFLTRIKPIALWPMIPLGIGIRVFYESLLRVLPQAWTGLAQPASEAVANSAIWAALAGYLLLLTMSFADDVLYRGLVYTRFSRQLPRWAAMLCASLLFGWGRGVFYIALGMALCWVLDQYGSLWAPIVLQLAAYFIGGQVSGLLNGILPVTLILSAAVCAASIWFISRQTKPEPLPAQPQGKTLQPR